MRVVIVLCLLVLLSHTARAEVGDTQADQVLSAVAAKNDAALRELARSDAPDPWYVAQALCNRGEFAAAIAFAQAGRRPATQALEAYVVTRKAEPTPDPLQTVLATVQQAIAERRLDEGMAALPQPRPPTTTVYAIALAQEEARMHQMQNRVDQAAATHQRAAEGAEEIGWRHRAGLGFTLAGRLHGSLHATDRAYACFERGLAHWQAIDFSLGVGAVLMEWGAAARSARRNYDAVGHYERALPILSALGDKNSTAIAIHQLALAYQDLGDFRRALESSERVLPLWKELGNEGEWAGAVINMGNVEFTLGNYPASIAHFETGIQAARTAGHTEYESYGTLNLAGVYWRIGNLPRALAMTEQAIEKMKAAGKPDPATRALLALGMVRADLGDSEGAMRYFSAALVQGESIHSPELQAAALENMANLHREQGDHAKAITLYTQAKAFGSKAGDRSVEARCIGGIGAAKFALGQHEEGIALLEQASREARHLRERTLLVWCLSELSKVHLEKGAAERAMFLAREAQGEVEHLLGGLGADDAATARGKYATVFANGALAAVRTGDAAEALTFLENGRAGALLELLGGRQALRWSDVPETLRRLEADARTHEADAQAAYRRALDTGDRQGIGEAAQALDRAQSRVAETTQRILGTASRRTTSVLYPRAATLEEIQKFIGEDEVLVIYGVGAVRSIAVVLTPMTARAVELGASQEVWTASQALSFQDPSVDPAPAIAHARKVLVAPLKLPTRVRRVLISPEAALCYVPFALLLDAPVALLPSGTTHIALSRGATHNATGVLALGAPSYGTTTAAAQETYTRGGALLPLPATGPEAQAVGDTVLLGDSANETELRDALAKQERWRAVHFACHGLINRERPLLCSLALSAAPGQDGFLTALEILRMEIPADLAVLSACETGKGEMVWGEGIVGLTRAFMYAGAPRVLCSLWKVDDNATKALMVKFYELWNPKALPADPTRPPGAAGSPPRQGPGRARGAAQALQEAQAWIRKQPKWSHPTYWAGWVLWGLPD